MTSQKDLYRRKIIKITKHLVNEDLEKLKYLNDAAHMDNINSPLKLIQFLEKGGILGFDKLEIFTNQLREIDKHHLIEILLSDISPTVEKLETKRFTHGCILIFNINKVKEVKKVEIRYSNYTNGRNDNWQNLFICSKSCIKEQIEQSYCNYAIKSDKLLLKVENFFHLENVNFQIHFIDVNEKEFSFCYDVDFRDMWDYELINHCNQLIFMLPEPINNSFCENLKTLSSLDWRKYQAARYPNYPNDKNIVLCAEDYMDRHYPNFKGVICNFKKNFHVFTDANLSNVVEKFIGFLNKGKHISALLTNYPLNYHAKHLDIPCDKLSSDENRLIIFNSKHNLVLFVRIALLECIKNECENHLFDVTLFCTINMPLIKIEELNFVGIVVFPLVEREELKKQLKEQYSFQFSDKFKLDKFLFLCKNEISSEEDFEKWWTLFNKYLSKKRNRHTACNEDFFKKLIGLSVFFMASCDHFNLPSLYC